MRIATQTAEQNLSFPYDKVFDAIVAVIQTRNGFKLVSQDPLRGRITVNTGVSRFYREEDLTFLVESTDADNTLVAIESALKPGLASGGVCGHAQNFNSVIEAVRMRFRKQRLKNTTGATNLAMSTRRPAKNCSAARFCFIGFLWLDTR